jgi:hypothetical protein
VRANRCDCCGGKFGLVLHRSWSRGLCSKHCKQLYQEQKRRPTPWSRFLACCGGRGLDAVAVTMQSATGRVIGGMPDSRRRAAVGFREKGDLARLLKI